MSTRRNRKKLNKAVTGAAIMIALSAAPLMDAHAVTDNLDMQAVITPTGQSIMATQNLDFGVVAQSGAGTVTVDTAGSASYALGAIDAGGTPEEGIIQTFGNINDSVAFTIPASATLTNGLGDTMVVDQFNLNGGGLADTIIMTATNVGIPVGGRLNVGAGQATGNYNGTVTVTATFN